jgi:hypothetical protein
MDTTSQTSSPQAGRSTAVARQSYPISFNLHDRDLQHVLYILDDPQGQHLTLQLTNTSGRDIVLAEKGSVVDETNHHFELRFRPGALAADSLDLITLAPDGWKLSHSPANAEGPVSLFLLSTTELTLKAGKELTLELEHVNADGRGGSRGTNVELRHKNLQYPGSPPEDVASTRRLEHLSMVNHRGQKHIPLHVGFVGSNTILNDGGSPNELTLRITNVLKDRSLSLKDDSKFTLSFDVYQGAEQKDWALAEVTSVANLRITSEVWKKNNGKWEGSRPTPIPAVSVAQSPEWPLQLAAPVELGPGEYLLLNIKELRSAAPTGHANLYVRYENIPGYWDGQFVCVIEKGPVVYRGRNVGIGVAQDPNSIARLQVAGAVKITADKGLEEGKSRENLVIETGPFQPEARLAFRTADSFQNTYIWPVARLRAGWFDSDSSEIEQRRLAIEIFKDHSAGEVWERLMTFRAGGKIGIGTDRPDAKLHLKGDRLLLSGEATDAELELSAKPNHARIQTSPNKPLTLNANGNRVGIGIENPEAKLHVTGGAGEVSVKVTGGQPRGLREDAPPVLYVTGAKGGDVPDWIETQTGNRAGDGADVYIRAGDGGNVVPNPNFGYLGPRTGGEGGKITLQPGRWGSGLLLSGAVPYAELSLAPEGGSVTIGREQQEFFWDAGSMVSPKVRLDVYGPVFARGVDAGGHDLAENYFSDLPLKPGDVVCMDPDDDRIVPSAKPNDQMAVGIVSTEPGFRLNVTPGNNGREDGMQAYPVALCGRVPCRVVDENGPIRRGDLLTTSTTPGHAMKAVPLKMNGMEIYRPGTIIGKALESHAGDVGMIEVLIAAS